MRILTAEAMQKVDRVAIDSIGIPSLVLMENAAVGVVDALSSEFPATRSVAVFCGPGNNGGDGLAVARHLAVRGYSVTTFLVTSGDDLRGDAAVQLEIARSMGLVLREIEPEESLAAVLDSAAACDVIVDALFGTGLARPLEGRLGELVAVLNELPVPVVATDLPSGLSGSRSDVFGPVLEAELTVTFGAAKIPHVFPPASALVGRVVVADLGIPRELLERAEGDLHLLTEDGLAPLVTVRPIESHKGDYGHILVVGGAVGTSGAVVLAARGALRVGAGLVTVVCPASSLQIVEAASVESMTIALPADAGSADGQRFDDASVEAVIAAAEGKSYVALGPGLGRSRSTDAAVRRLVKELSLPMVLDADGLNAFAGRIGELRERTADTILTPHPGELARLLGVGTDEVVADRLGAVRRACSESGAVVVLKGHLSLIADPMGGVYVNPTGNPGMATGGSGDVLTGVISSLAGQGYSSLDAARVGVYLHGMAGDLAASEVGEAGLVAGDIAESLPAALQLLGSA